MDSKKKTSSSDTVDDLDLEALNLDFELPAIDDSDLVGLESGSDLSTLDIDFGDSSGLGSSSSASSDSDFNLPDSTSDLDFGMGDSDSSGMDFSLPDVDSDTSSLDFDTSDVGSADLDSEMSGSAFSDDSEGLYSITEDEEPITLTADELSDIVGADFEGDESFNDSVGDSLVGASLYEANEEADGFDDSTDDSKGYGDLEELDLEMTDGDDGLVLPELDITDFSGPDFQVDTAALDGEFPGLEGDSDFEPTVDHADDLSIPLPALDEDEEDVALSEAELDSILGDVDRDVVDQGGDERIVHEGMVQEIDDADGLEISDEELQREVIGGDAALPQLSILDSEEDESITLTADELSNIVAGDAEGSPYGEGEEILTDDLYDDQPVQEFDGFGDLSDTETPSDSVIDIDDYPEEPKETSFFQEEEDEGPVALTDSELADILEGTALEVEEASPEGLEAPALSEPPRSERMADELSLETGVKRDELKKVIGYLDDLLGQLPEETVREFSRSEYFNLYKKVIEELGVFK